MVLIHEFGHFIVAKLKGVRVEEFGWGLPPRIFGKKIGETIYSINLLPFGGFVRLTGEELEEAQKNEELDGLPSDIKPLDSHNFMAKTPWQRIQILTAGVFMNMVLAVSLFYVFLAANNFSSTQMPLLFDFKFKFGESTVLKTVVSGIQDGSAAQQAGFESGEAITQVNSIQVNSVDELKQALLKFKGEEVSVYLTDLKSPNEPKTRVVTVLPKFDSNGQPVLGVYLSEAVSVAYNKPLEKLFAGFLHSYNVIDYSLSTMGGMISLSVKTHDISPVSESVSGPVGIYNLVGLVLEYGGDRAWLTLVDYTALMSVSLAMVNILPFPALDGGRLVFEFYEWVAKKRPNPKIEARIHQIGMAFLLLLLVLITAKDILS